METFPWEENGYLQSFLNIQSSDFLLGDEVLLMGHFDFGDFQFLIDKNAHGEEERSTRQSSQEVKLLCALCVLCG